MSRVPDLEADVLLSRLATRAVKHRNEAHAKPITYTENKFTVVAWWEDKVFRIEIAKEQ
jgi:hypothetical protein